MPKYICREQEGWGTVINETEKFWTVRWNGTINVEDIRKDDDFIIDWSDNDEEVKNDPNRDDPYRDYWEEPDYLEMGFDPYEGCYTYDC